MKNPMSNLRALAIVLCATLIFSCQPQGEGATTSGGDATMSAGGGDLSVVYLRLDSLQTGYTALAAELTRLEENAGKADENIQAEIAKFQREVNALQNKAQQGLLTPNKMRTEQERLGRREQEIAQQRDIALGAIQQEQMQLQQVFSTKVKDILEALQAEKGYDLILNEGGGGGLLLGSDRLDITDLVLERLNAAGEAGLQDTIQ